MPKIVLVIVSMLTLVSRAADAEALYQYMDSFVVQSQDLEPEIQTTMDWTAHDMQRVDRYFLELGSLAPDLKRMISLVTDLGPIQVIKVSNVKRSLGFVTQSDKTYLFLSDMFFRVYDRTSPDIGYDGGNFTFWFFVHEIVHVAEYRSSFASHALRPSLDPNSIVFLAFSARIEEAKLALERQGTDLDLFVFGDDLSQIHIVHDAGLPTKYCLLSPTEALADVITATVLSATYEPPAEIQQAIDAFYER